jgi:hypothetical protein
MGLSARRPFRCSRRRREYGYVPCHVLFTVYFNVSKCILARRTFGPINTMLNTPGYVTASRRTSSSMEAELADLKALMELKKMYSWKDDNPLFLKRQGDIMKKHAKLSKGIQKKKGGTALCKPRIHSWATVSTVKVKDFKDVHSKLSVISEGIWVADRWSRGGVLNYMDEPACSLHALGVAA